MDVGFDDSQLELRAAVRDVLARECSASVLREALVDPDRWRPLWRTVADLGWTALAMFEPGLGVVELVAVLEECGAAAAPMPLLSSSGLAAGVLRSTGHPGKLSEELAGGAVGALGATAPGARGLTPSLRWAQGRLTGTTGPVADAERADLFVLLAISEVGETVAAVVRPGPGVVIRSMEAVDPTRPLGEVAVDTVPETVLTISLPDALALPLTAAAAELG